MQQVVAERLVRRYNKMRIRVFVSLHAAITGTIRLTMPVELARLQEAQRLGTKIALHNAGNNKDALFHLTGSVQVRESTQANRGLSRTDTQAKNHAFVGTDQLNRPLTRSAILAAHRRLEQLDWLARLELLTDGLHHVGYGALCGMA